MTIEYNKIKFHNNELLSITNTEKSENSTNLSNNSNKKLVCSYNNTEIKKTHLKREPSANLPKYVIRKM